MFELVSTDVLVIGGGPAGAWAAISASNAGSTVVLVDKGYMSTSGAMAIATTGMVQELKPMLQFYEYGGRMARPTWQKQVINEIQKNDIDFPEWFNFYVSNYLQGLEIMKIFRSKLIKNRVKILDHSPALHLHKDETTQSVCGARIFDLKKNKMIDIFAKAVVIATGGCGWKSGTFGCHTNTGDGYLMAEEAGAKLSSMEFGSFYAIAPKNTTVTKGIYYRLFGSFKDEYNNELSLTEVYNSPHKVYSRFDRANAKQQAKIQIQQPNLFLVFEKMGINPFTDWFELSFIQEGTMRTGGGIYINNLNTCQTNVDGLYAAGDAAYRTPIVGATLIPEAYVTWAVASGKIAGRNAAITAQNSKDPLCKYHDYKYAGLDTSNIIDEKKITIDVQQEFLPKPNKNLINTHDIQDRLNRVSILWDQVKNGCGESPVKSREAAAMVHTARRVIYGQKFRNESRGAFYHHADYPDSDANQHHYICQGGMHLDEISYDRVSI